MNEKTPKRLLNEVESQLCHHRALPAKLMQVHTLSRQWLSIRNQTSQSRDSPTVLRQSFIEMR